MSLVPFEILPDTSRLWIFAADRKLSDTEADALTREMQSFVHSWMAHGMAVTGSCEMKYGQFLLIAADESRLPSGCSTDEMTRRVRMLGETFGVEFLGMPRVQYLTNGSVRSVMRSDFGDLAKTGTVNSQTIVFDNTLTTLGDLRSGKWEIPAKESWHARAFDLVP